LTFSIGYSLLLGMGNCGYQTGDYTYNERAQLITRLYFMHCQQPY